MRVLIAEDDPISGRLLAVTLRKWGFQVQAVSDGRQAWEALDAEDAPKLAILDWMMPEVDGVEVCRRVRQRPDREYTYIILLTARDRKQDILSGLEAGADDYVVKPFDSDELRMRLNTAQRILRLQADLIAARERLRDQATHDDLTGLWNRSAILEILQRELNRAAREGREVGVAMADLGRFKEINDRFGHTAGDVALRKVARRMTSALRPYDAVGRYGGDELLIVLPGCDDAAGAAELAERLRLRVAALPVRVAGENIPVTITLGATSSRGATGADVNALVNAADEAMYSAKQAGRNRVAAAPVEIFQADEGVSSCAAGSHERHIRPQPAQSPVRDQRHHTRDRWEQQYDPQAERQPPVELLVRQHALACEVCQDPFLKLGSEPRA